MISKIIRKQDRQIAKLIDAEEKRQQETIDLIASENYPSLAVREVLSSIFVAKYSEGRPYKRYYAGMENVDKLEVLAENRARKAFDLDQNWSVNVQPYSGSPANYAVLRGILKPGDKILSLLLSQGGHLTHGAPASVSGQDFKVVSYLLNNEGFLDYEAIESLALQEKPNLIITGYSAYPRTIDFKRFGEIAKKAGAFLMADIAHIAGLIAGKAHPSPFPYADIVTTTTHKTLRGPRGAIIFCKKELEKKIFPKVFPGLQGGPHNHTIAGISIALKEAASPAFRKYAAQIVKNSKALSQSLGKYNFSLVSGGTDNHLMLINITNKGTTGNAAQILLEKAGIVINKNTVPNETRPPYDPSGIRLGTPAVTTRHMKEKEMVRIAGWINEVISKPSSVIKVKKEVQKFCRKFPIW